MTIFAVDAADSGEIVLHPAVVDTERIEVGDETRRLNAYLATAPFPTLRLADADHDNIHDTGEVPLLGPTGAELAVAARVGRLYPLTGEELMPPNPGEPVPPPPGPGPQPGPPPPAALVEPAAEYPTVRPAVPVAVVEPRYAGRHRARRPWGHYLLTFAVAFLGGVLGGGAVLVVAVLAVNR